MRFFPLALAFALAACQPPVLHELAYNAHAQSEDTAVDTAVDTADTAAVDTASDDTATDDTSKDTAADTAVDTAPSDTGTDTGLDTGSVDTGADTGAGDTAADTAADTGEAVDTGGVDTGDVDTGDSADSADSAPACSGIDAFDPIEIHVTTGTPVSTTVTLTGCATNLVAAGSWVSSSGVCRLTISWTTPPSDFDGTTTGVLYADSVGSAGCATATTLTSDQGTQYLWVYAD